MQLFGCIFKCKISHSCSLTKNSTKAATPRQSVVEEEHHDGAYSCDEHRIEIEPGDALAADMGENIPADAGANDTQDDIQDAAFAALIDDVAREKAGNQPKDNPADERHACTSKLRLRVLYLRK